LPCCTLLLCFTLLALCLVAWVTLLLTICCSRFVAHNLLFTICCSQFVTRALLPCNHALLVVGPCYLAIMPSCLHFLGTSYPSPSPCYFATLLLIVVPCCFALSVGIPSSFFYANGGAWSNTNKLHLTTKVIFFSRFSWVFFSLLCILFVYFVFVCHFF
jgi:hypothetical protein